MVSRVSKTVKLLLEKARDSATQAISTYNDPRSSFRTGNFIILMIIAWTALLHSYFEKQKIKYFYKKPNGRYETIDGERKAWDLLKAARKIYPQESPVYKNLELFARLRNRIEHRNLPALDPELIGECQALVLNFEQKLFELYGKKYSLIDTIFVPIQLTSSRRVLPKTKIEENILDFIKRYRDILSSQIINSQQYSFKAYLVPKIGNHRSSSDLAIEFIKFDENNPKEMEKYQRAVIAIKEKQVPVANVNFYRPSMVMRKLKDRRLNKTMNWHTIMWHKYKVRPPKNDKNTANCKTEYCVFDKAHSDYLYTDAWVELLFKEGKKK
jgi:hypothetical protein